MVLCLSALAIKLCFCDFCCNVLRMCLTKNMVSQLQKPLQHCSFEGVLVWQLSYFDIQLGQCLGGILCCPIEQGIYSHCQGQRLDSHSGRQCRG